MSPRKTCSRPQQPSLIPGFLAEEPSIPETLKAACEHSISMNCKFLPSPIIQPQGLPAYQLSNGR